MFELIATIAAVYVLLAIAFPKYLLPQKEPDEKMVGSAYWGVYHDAPQEDLAVAGKVLAPPPARKRKGLAGSQVYAGGNGRR